MADVPVGHVDLPNVVAVFDQSVVGQQAELNLVIIVRFAQQL